MQTRQVANGRPKDSVQTMTKAKRKPKKGSKSKPKKAFKKQPSIRDSLITEERSFDDLMAPPTPMPSPRGSQAEVDTNMSRDSWGFQSEHGDINKSSTPNKSRDKPRQNGSGMPNMDIDDRTGNTGSDSCHRLLVCELTDANTRLQNQIELLESDIDNHIKLDQAQKTAIKKLKRENDNLRRELSKCTGIRKYMSDTPAVSKSTSAPTPVPRDAVTLTQVQLDSLKDHVKDTISNLFLDADTVNRNIEHDSDTPINPDLCDEQYQPVIRRRKWRCRATQTVTVTQTNVEQQTHDGPTSTESRNKGPDTSRRHGNNNQQPSAHQQRSYRDVAMSRPPRVPNTVIIGTSLVRGVGAHLHKRGIDNACYTYPGAEIPCIRDRVNNILPRNANPRQIVLQAGGNDLERHPPHAVVNQYDRLISELKRRCPKSSILLGRIPPRRYDGWTNEQIDKVNTFLEDRSKRGDGVHFVDTCPRFPMQFKRDRVHFTKSGSQVYADKLACSLINFQMYTRNRRS